MFIRIISSVSFLLFSSGLYAESRLYTEIFTGYAYGYNLTTMSMRSGEFYNYPHSQNGFMQFTMGKEWDRVFLNKVGFVADGKFSREKVSNSETLIFAGEIKFLRCLKFQAGMGAVHFNRQITVREDYNEKIPATSEIYYFSMAFEINVFNQFDFDAGYRYEEGTGSAGDCYLKTSMLFASVGFRL